MDPARPAPEKVEVRQMTEDEISGPSGEHRRTGDAAAGQAPRRTGVFGNVAIVLAGLFYIFSATDLVPDFMPVVGWLDDLAVGWFLLLPALKRLFGKPAEKNGMKGN